MGFLKNIFKKKPGGTLLGNLVRGVSSAATGGILGSGANRIEVGQTQTNAQLAQAAAEAQNTTYTNPTIAGLQAAAVTGVANTPQIQAAAATGIMEKMKQNWVALVAVVAALFFGYQHYSNNKKTKGKRF